MFIISPGQNWIFPVLFFRCGLFPCLMGSFSSIRSQDSLLPAKNIPACGNLVKRSVTAGYQQQVAKRSLPLRKGAGTTLYRREKLYIFSNFFLLLMKEHASRRERITSLRECKLIEFIAGLGADGHYIIQGIPHVRCFSI